MLRKLLPVILLIVGLGGGVGAGIFLKPAAAPVEEHAAETDAHGNPVAAEHGADTGHGATAEAGHGDGGASQYLASMGPTETVRLPNQFVVPILTNGRVEAMVVVGLAMEMSVGHQFSLVEDEPRLRAALLQLLFDHANIGGFSGIFTSGEALLQLRRMLREAARQIVGPEVQDILITELLRQDS
ncbi:flagellar basal body-associated protein FliL [Cereibacter sphaeroides]|nr:flagellar basal body-associated protein FliL [Cereibacter sphaeroides]